MSALYRIGQSMRVMFLLMMLTALGNTCEIFSTLLRAQEVQLEVVEHTLDNGMRILMVERHDAPVATFFLQFKVGGVNDPSGRAGIAHLLEHMMFKGTRIYGTTNYEKEVPIMKKIDEVYAELNQERQKLQSPFEAPDEARIEQLEEEMAALQKEQQQYVVTDELSQTYERLGAVGLNASTGADSTQYFVSLPSNQLEVWAYVESDRIANPVLREFYLERDVVHEERRLRTDTRPGGLLWENFLATAFQAHPYRNPVVGWASDIDNMTREEVLQYFKTFYAPNNAIVAIVGDIDPDKTIAIMEKYFGEIPPQTQPNRYISEEPEQKGERRVVVRFDAQPEMMIGYHIPQMGHDDTYALDVMSSLLTGVTRGSRTGRLTKSLVLEKKLALNVNAGLFTSLYPHLFVISATPNQGVSVAEVEEAIYEEIEKFQTSPPTDEELARVRNAVDAQMVRSLRSNYGVGRMITYLEYVAGDWQYLFTERDKIKSVSGGQVQAVAKKYFTDENRTVAELQPLNEGSKGIKAPPDGTSSGAARQEVRQ
jgi:predicted Zn-dependent peptidase